MHKKYPWAHPPNANERRSASKPISESQQHPLDATISPMAVNRPRRVRLAEVAKAAGVSVSTASRALNGYADITLATRTRVEEIAAKLGYRAHNTARSLRTGDVGIVAAVIDHESLDPGPGRISYFWSRFLSKLTAGLAARGYALLTVTHETAPDVLNNLPYDAVMLLSTRTDVSDVVKAVPFGVPLVVRPGQVGSDRSKITLGHDFAGATQTVLDHLVASGSGKPAVILPAINHTFIKQMQAAVDAWHPHSAPGHAQLRMSNGHDLVQLVEELVADGCDSLFCAAADAPATLAAVRAAKKIPGVDFLIVTQSDGPLDLYMDPPVSTLAFLPELGAATAMQALEDALAGKHGEFLLPYELTVRASSSGPMIR